MIKNILIFSGLVAIPIVLWSIPADFFDSGLPPLCPSQMFLHRNCPGCGITRSVQHAMHLDFPNAWHFNKLIILVLPGLIYYWSKYVIHFGKALLNSEW